MKFWYPAIPLCSTFFTAPLFLLTSTVLLFGGTATEQVFGAAPGARDVLSSSLSLQLQILKAIHGGKGAVRTLTLLLSLQDLTQLKEYVLLKPSSVHSFYLTSPLPFFQLNSPPPPEILKCHLLFFYRIDHLKPYNTL